MNFRLYTHHDWNRIVEYVRNLPWQRDGRGIVYKLSIDEQKPKRSIDANRRYWALVTAISQQAPAHMGGEYHDPEVWHEYAARRFLGMTAGPFGTGVRKSTSGLTVGQFAAYMEEVEAWAAEEFPGFDFEWEQAA